MKFFELQTLFDRAEQTAQQGAISSLHYRQIFWKFIFSTFAANYDEDRNMIHSRGIISEEYFARQSGVINLKDYVFFTDIDGQERLFHKSKVVSDYFTQDAILASNTHRIRADYPNEYRAIYSAELIEKCHVIGSFYYVKEHAEEWGIIRTVEGDYLHRNNAYIWEDGTYHRHAEPITDFEDDEEDDSYSNDDYDNDRQRELFGYHSGQPRGWRATSETRFTIGFEIEKGAFPEESINRHKLLEKGWVAERDGSVDGFELISPTFDLDKVSVKDFAPVEFMVNVRDVQNCGGHIHIGEVGKTDDEFFESIKNYLPLIFAMYPTRLNNSYCSGKKPETLKHNKREKYQAVAFHGNRIELRIIGPVKNMEQIQFRIDLMKAIVKHQNADFGEVLRLATKPGTQLNRVLTGKVYKDPAKFERLIRRAIALSKTYEIKIHRRTEDAALKNAANFAAKAGGKPIETVTELI